MGLFSKPQPKKKKSLFSGLFANSNNGWANRNETKHRIAWAQERSGVVADAVDDYKRKRGGFSKTEAEDIRRELARKDSYFKYADAKDVADALK
ncbi:MAG: hypothetical protein LBM97_01890 [Candidatus Nomurabacteria bacterium]|jgi:hypothetical protein|nr:hypothetical protein [Candidatus Nomurabacteria bacterium]